MTSGGTVDPRRIEALCAAYYGPIAAFIRSICPQRDDAEDLTQGFMADLARGKYLVSADPREGRFRSFLCQCARNFARSEWRHRATQRLGGSVEHVPFDEAAIEAAIQPAVEEFDRAWVGVVIDRTLATLREEHSRHGGASNFELLVEGLGWTGSIRSSSELAGLAGMTPGAYSTAVSRLRARFRDYMRNEVRRVVTAEEEVDAELRYYLGLFGDNGS